MFGYFPAKIWREGPIYPELRGPTVLNWRDDLLAA